MIRRWLPVEPSVIVLALVVICFAASASAQTPSNSCTNAPLVAVPGQYAGSTVGATADASATCGTAGATPDVWVRFVANHTATVMIDTCTGTEFDSILSVRSGCTGVELECNDDFCGITSGLSVDVTAGVSYWVRVSGFSGEIGPFILSLSFIESRPPPTPGPDVVVSELTSVHRWGSINGTTAYSIGTTACSVGDTDLVWAADSNEHPVISQSVFRLHEGRFEQIGLSWVRHAFGAVNDDTCGPCNGRIGNVLGIGCSDPYGAGLNGEQLFLGPRSEVHPTNGAFPFPVSGPPISALIDRRLQVRDTEIDSHVFQGAAYFAEALYVSPDDALAHNSLNNASYRCVDFPTTGAEPVFGGATQSQVPAITAWREADPTVTEVFVDYTEAGLPARFIVAAKATEQASGVWRYEYAVYNQNSDRAASSFAVPLPLFASAANIGFHDVDYHSGDGVDDGLIDGTDWTPLIMDGRIEWGAAPFAENPNANALRWGTLYNFRFDAAIRPAMGRARIGLFKPGTLGEPNTLLVSGLPVPLCRADWDRSGYVNSQDFFDFVVAMFQGTADFNEDSVVDTQDYFEFLGAYFSGC